MLHPEMSGADDLETALAGPLAADDHASVPLPAPASSNLPLKNGSQRAAFIIHFPPFSIFPLFFSSPNAAVPLVFSSSFPASPSTPHFASLARLAGAGLRRALLQVEDPRRPTNSACQLPHGGFTHPTTDEKGQ